MKGCRCVNYIIRFPAERWILTYFKARNFKEKTSSSRTYTAVWNSKGNQCFLIFSLKKMQLQWKALTLHQRKMTAFHPTSFPSSSSILIPMRYIHTWSYDILGPLSDFTIHWIRYLFSTLISYLLSLLHPKSIFMFYVFGTKFLMV